MNHLSFALSVLAFGSVTVPASAQRSNRQATEHVFVDGDLVEGDFARPHGEVFVRSNRGDRRTLVRVRSSLVPELVKSAEN
ncbi:MAG: hypothetical protein AAGH15_10900 [Myxococcota bacterium]